MSPMSSGGGAAAASAASRQRSSTKTRQRSPSPSTSGTPGTPADEMLISSNPAAAAAAAAAMKRKRVRVSRACDSCYAKKDKCDGVLPVCKVCRDLDRICTYNRPERKRGPLQGVRQRLEAQVEILESVLGYLVDTFPGLSNTAVRPLILDDGEGFIRRTLEQAGASSLSNSATSNVVPIAGPSRIPAGNIYPNYSKAEAKELWRRSSLAKSIAPSLGLRLGLQEEEEDLIDIDVYRQRAEEAKRARAFLNTTDASHAQQQHTHSRRGTATPFASYPPAPSIYSAPHSSNPFGHPAAPPPFAEMESGLPLGAVHTLAPASTPAQAFAHSHPQFQTSLPPVSGGHLAVHTPHHHAPSYLPASAPAAATSVTKQPSTTISHAQMPPQSAHESDYPFSSFNPPWSSDDFSIGELGEDAHALIYALGLPNTVEGGRNHQSHAAASAAAAVAAAGAHIVAATNAQSPDLLAHSMPSPRPFYGNHPGSSPSVAMPSGGGATTESKNRSSPLHSHTNAAQTPHAYAEGHPPENAHGGIRMFGADEFEEGANYPSEQVVESTIWQQLGLQDTVMPGSGISPPSMEVPISMLGTGLPSSSSSAAPTALGRRPPGASDERMRQPWPPRMQVQ